MDNINSFLSTIDFIVVAIYLFVLIAIGYWVSFVKKKDEDANLFLAARSLNWSKIGLTMWGTNVGPSMLIASASIGYTSGVVAGNFSWYAFVFILLLATVFAPRYLGAKVQTLPEFMGKRFGQSTRSILAWYTLIATLISWLALTLFAGGILVGQILNISLFYSVIILMLISGFFTVAGGLKAIAYTNVFQMILLIVVSMILTVIGIVKAGGPAAIVEATPANYWNLFQPLDDPNYPWIAIVLGYPIMGVWFWCTDQSMVQSVLGAKNLKQGQMGANFTGWLKILDVFLFIIPGVICFVLFPNLSNPDEAYMTMVTRLLPVGLIGLVMSVLIAALVSTIGSALNSLSTVFTMDIYVKNYKPEATPKQVIKTGRIVTVIGAFLAVVCAVAIDSIKGLNLFDVFQAVLGFLAPPMSVVFLFGVLWKKTTKKAANFTLSVGTLISLGTGVMYLWVFPNEKYDFWPHFLLLSFFIFILLAVLAFLISKFDKTDDTQVEFNYGKLPKPDRQVSILWGALVAVMIGLYLIFNLVL
ncbi:sodium:solute symporter [uncultured Draconibacterium sp.]|uniref:sodium:solute symporter n=1 Tax=uncultured Draconibacterium sp. TaxID=1573823 RepID=UPI0025F55B4F|nr:sodium:solute symporter [uncultured Draconibacterium sp.]